MSVRTILQITKTTFLETKKMAKAIQINSIYAAIGSILDAIEIEKIPNPTEEQKQQIYDVTRQAVSIVRTSNLMTMAEHGDDHIETAHQVDAVFEEAGINPVEYRRQMAIEGAQMTVDNELERRAAIELAEAQNALEAAQERVRLLTR